MNLFEDLFDFSLKVEDAVNLDICLYNKPNVHTFDRWGIIKKEVLSPRSQNLTKFEYFVRDAKHRDTLPAEYRMDENRITVVFYNKGLKHRVNEPAVIYMEIVPYGVFGLYHWMLHGKDSIYFENISQISGCVNIDEKFPYLNVLHAKNIEKKYPCKNPSSVVYKHGLLYKVINNHNIDGFYNEVCHYRTETWYKDAKIHRSKKPASIAYDWNGVIRKKEWKRMGEYYRSRDRPSVIEYGPDGKEQLSQWYENGQLKKEAYFNGSDYSD